MTSPVEQIVVRCRCGHLFTDWHRSSLNLELDPWIDPAYVREASTATCPSCGAVTDLGTLVVSQEDGVEVWTAR
jgi:hypothetical protein